MSSMGENQQSEPLQRRFINFATTRKGAVILSEIVASLIMFICFCASTYGSYSVAAILEMIFCIVFFVIYMNHFDLSITFIHWPWTDMLRCVIATIIYIVVGIVSVLPGNDGARIAAGVFALIGAGFFGYDAFLIFPRLKQGSQHTPAPTDMPQN